MWAGPQCCSAAVSAWRFPSGRSSGAPLCWCDGWSPSPAASSGPGYEPASTRFFSLPWFPHGTEAECGSECQVWRRTHCTLAEAPGAFFIFWLSFSSKQVQQFPLTSWFLVRECLCSTSLSSFFFSCDISRSSFSIWLLSLCFVSVSDLSSIPWGKTTMHFAYNTPQ